MKHFIGFVVVMMVAMAGMGCTTSAVEHISQQSTSNFDWVLGSWTCTGNYHNVPPFSARSESSTYEFALVDGALHGSYRPVQTGGKNLPGSDEVWTPLGNGNAMDIQLSYTDGSLSTSGSGESQGALDDVVLGLADFDGRGGKGAWRHSAGLFSFENSMELFMSSYLGDDTALFLYLDSSCVPKQLGELAVASLK